MFRFPRSMALSVSTLFRGADKLLEALTKKIGIGVGETTPDAKFSLRTLRCVGACGLAPVVMINDKVYGRCTPDMIDGIIDECE